MTLPELLPELPKVYIYCTGVWRSPEGRITDYVMVAVAEDAELLGSHVCSHPSFAMGDLHNQRGRHEAYEAKFGGWDDGQYYRVVQVPDGEEPPAELMQLIVEKNAAADRLCGDCTDGKCHGGDPEYCECARHAASVEAATEEPF